MRRPAARAPLFLLCVCVCVHAPQNPPSQVLSLKCIIIPLCQERRQIVSPSAIAVSFLFSRSYTPRLHLFRAAQRRWTWRKKGGVVFFILPPGPHKTHNGGGEKKRAVIANSINCRSTCDARTSGIANKARLTLGVSMRLCQTPHCSSCLHLFRRMNPVIFFFFKVECHVPSISESRKA